jgi:hypothetical protein
VADGYIVKLSTPVLAVCANGKEYNSSLTVKAQGEINFEMFPMDTECSITVALGTILDSNNNGQFDSDDKALAFDMIGSSDDTFISPLTTLLYRKLKAGEDVRAFGRMIQNYNPVVAPSRSMSNTGIEKVKIEKLIILMEVLKTAMKQSADITKLDLSGIVKTNKTDSIESLNIDRLIANLSNDIKSSVKEKALAIKALVKKLQNLNSAKVNINSLFVSVSDGGKSVDAALSSSLLVSLPSGVGLEDFLNPSYKSKDPIANAGVDQTVLFGKPCVLDGSKSTAVDAEIVSYEWMENGENLAKRATSTNNNKAISIDTLSVGKHIIHLYVSDSKGRFSLNSDEVIITIKDDGSNKAPIAKAGADQNVTEGTVITLDASKSTDSDGEIKAYEWWSNEKLLDESVSITLNNLSVGVHVITLIVKDNQRAVGSDTVLVIVKKIISRDDENPINGEGSIDLRSYLEKEDITKNYQLINKEVGKALTSQYYTENSVVTAIRVERKLEGITTEIIDIRENNLTLTDVSDEGNVVNVFFRNVNLGETLFSAEINTTKLLKIGSTEVGSQTRMGTSTCVLTEQLTEFTKDSHSYTGDILKTKCTERTTMTTEVKAEFVGQVNYVNGTEDSVDISYLYDKKDVGRIASINDDCIPPNMSYPDDRIDCSDGNKSYSYIYYLGN